MKRLMLCIAIMFVIVAISLWGICETKKIKAEAEEAISTVGDLILKEETEKARESFSEFKASWEKFSKKSSYVIENDELKEISQLVSQLEIVIYTEPENFFSYGVVLKDSVAHLLKTEIPDIEGLF